MWQYEVERKEVRQEKKNKRNGVIKKKTLGNKKVVRCVENEKKRKHKTKEMEQKERKKIST